MHVDQINAADVVIGIRVNRVNRRKSNSVRACTRVSFIAKTPRMCECPFPAKRVNKHYSIIFHTSFGTFTGPRLC